MLCVGAGELFVQPLGILHAAVFFVGERFVVATEDLLPAEAVERDDDDVLRRLGGGGAGKKEQNDGDRSATHDRRHLITGSVACGIRRFKGMLLL